MTPKLILVRHYLFMQMLTVQFMYKMCYGIQVILYIFLLKSGMDEDRARYLDMVNKL